MAQETGASPTELIIEHDKVDLRVRLSRSNVLFVHEETIPERVAKIRELVLHDRIVRDPIVIDNASSVVLDGTHRLVALRQLGCLRVPVCAVDYLNTSMKVRTWYRTIPRQLPVDKYQDSLLTYDIRLVQLPFDVNSLLESAPLAIALSPGECFALKNDEMEVHEILRKAEQCMLQFCPVVNYDTERDALDKLANGQAQAVMTLPRIEKSAVCEAGLTGHLFPHKVTRHVIPARPLGVNVALETLVDDGKSLEDANRQFLGSLKTRRATRRPLGSIIGNRRYEEETYTFNWE